MRTETARGRGRAFLASRLRDGPATGVVFFGVVTAAFAVYRMAGIFRIRHAVNFDETFVSTLARQPFHVIWTEVTHGEANSFLHYFLSAFVVRLVPGQALLALRVVSLLFIAGSCALLVKLAREFGLHQRAGVLAGMLYLSAPLTLRWAPAARYYSMYTFFTILTLLFSVRFVNRRSTAAAIGFMLAGIAAIATCALASLYVGVLALAVIVLVARASGVNPALRTSYALIMTPAAFAAGLGLLIKLNDRGQVSWVGQFSLRSALVFLDQLMLEASSTERLWVSGRIRALAIVGVLVGLVCIAAVLGWGVLRTNADGARLVVVACIVPVLTIFALALVGQSFMSARYLVPHSALLAFVAAAWLVGTSRTRMVHVAAMAAVGVLAVSVSLNAASVGFVRSAQTSRLRASLLDQARPGDLVYLNPMMHTALSFEAHEFGISAAELPRPVQPDVGLGGISRWGKIPKPYRVPATLDRTDRVWVVSARASAGAEARDTFEWVSHERWFINQLRRRGFVPQTQMPTDALVEVQRLELWVR